MRWLALSLDRRFLENVRMQIRRLPTVISLGTVLFVAAACGQGPPFLSSSAGNSGSTSEPTSTLAPAANTAEELAYFYEIAFEVEY